MTSSTLVAAGSAAHVASASSFSARLDAGQGLAENARAAAGSVDPQAG